MTGETGLHAVFGDDPPSVTDGKEHVTHPRQGKAIRMRSFWSGKMLVIHEVTTTDGRDFVSDVKWTLSDDREVLTMTEHYQEPGLERNRDWVFDKQ
jgi:hypothetical protein